MEEDKDVEVEWFQKIGEPLNIKTRKQGRGHSLSEAIKDKYDATSLTRDSSGNNGFVRRGKKLNSIKMTVVLINRIKKFGKSSEKEKKLCDCYLDWLENRDDTDDRKIASIGMAKIIAGINRRLTKKYGAEYTDCNLKRKKQ